MASFNSLPYNPSQDLDNKFERLKTGENNINNDEEDFSLGFNSFHQGDGWIDL